MTDVVQSFIYMVDMGGHPAVFEIRLEINTYGIVDVKE